nr:hypothetical protein [Komagataeibacter europaeus]
MLSHRVRCPSHRQELTASASSAKPGRGRPRSAASATARRWASIALATDTKCPSSRMAWTIRASQMTVPSARPRVFHRCAHHPGATTPAP